MTAKVHNQGLRRILHPLPPSLSSSGLLSLDYEILGSSGFMAQGSLLPSALTSSSAMPLVASPFSADLSLLASTSVATADGPCRSVCHVLSCRNAFSPGEVGGFAQSCRGLSSRRTQCFRREIGRQYIGARAQSAAVAEPPQLSQIELWQEGKRLQTQTCPVVPDVTTIRSLDWDRNRFDMSVRNSLLSLSRVQCRIASSQSSG